jgi:putative transposase
MKIKELEYKIWQRNYYEHIIRNEESHNKIAAYIRNNPANREEDEYFKLWPTMRIARQHITGLT